MSAEDKKVKIALDETRTLMLGAQILFGFQLRAAFQSQFDSLSSASRLLYSFAFLCMATAIGLLIAPSMQHRIVESGRSSGRIIAQATWFAGVALLPFAIGLGVDIAIVVGYRFGMIAGAVSGTAISAVALALWYGVEWLSQETASKERAMPEERNTPIDIRVEHMLTEARVLLPGAQALFGFQLVVFLTDGFDKLPESSKLIHTFALCCIALSVIFLMAPAAFHRIAFAGRDSERFHRIGSRFVIASAVPLAAGIAADIHVAVAKALDSQGIGAAAALAVAVLLVVLWFVQPLVLRAKRRGRARGSNRSRSGAA